VSADLILVPDVETIQSRLPTIFPEGSENRNYLVREMAAKTIFVMFYTDAIEGKNIWIRPDQVTKMSGEQATKRDEETRLKWKADSLAPGKMKDVPNRWYASNTREPIRDETLRFGLVMIGAVVERQGLPTTSSKPRYALNTDFAALFNQQLNEEDFKTAAAKWQETYLSVAALARIRLRSRGALAGERTSQVLVRLPNGETRRMGPGSSSVLTKAVIEEFSPRFMSEPAVVFISESGNKVIVDDYELAQSLGITIRPDRILPDIIMADIAPKKPLIIFAEVVITDGAITRTRLESLLATATEGGFMKERIAFVTAFQDRSTSAYKRLSSEIAWGSYVWFATEPDHLVFFADRKFKLNELLDFL